VNQSKTKDEFLMDLYGKYDMLITDNARDIFLARSPLGLAAYCYTILDGTV
jgi:hypothetical protein